MSFEEVAYGVYVGASALAGLPAVILAYQTGEGLKMAFKANYIMKKRELGVKTSNEDRWELHDARIDPFSTLFLRLSGKGKSLDRTIEEIESSKLAIR